MRLVVIHVGMLCAYMSACACQSIDVLVLVNLGVVQRWTI